MVKDELTSFVEDLHPISGAAFDRIHCERLRFPEDAGPMLITSRARILKVPDGVSHLSSLAGSGLPCTARPAGYSVFFEKRENGSGLGPIPLSDGDR